MKNWNMVWIVNERSVRIEALFDHVLKINTLIEEKSRMLHIQLKYFSHFVCDQSGQ